MKRARLLFAGDVEGTGYRFFIKQKAIELGLKGYCKAIASGKIEAEIEGSTAAVDAFIEFVQRGISLQAETNQFHIEIFNDLKGYQTMHSDIV